MKFNSIFALSLLLLCASSFSMDPNNIDSKEKVARAMQGMELAMSMLQHGTPAQKQFILQMVQSITTTRETTGRTLCSREEIKDHMTPELLQQTRDFANALNKAIEEEEK